MARIDGPERPGGLVRLAYWITKRKFGHVLAPVKIWANHPRLLRGAGAMEQAQEAARSVDAGLKSLAQVLAAMRVGCPF
jgi:alkylhydroperoxidase family enzyme